MSECHKQHSTMTQKRPVANPRGLAKRDRKEGFASHPQLQSISIPEQAGKVLASISFKFIALIPFHIFQNTP